MRSVLMLAVAGAMAVGCGPRAGTLEGASQTLRAGETSSIEFSGAGRWSQFGQAPGPELAWPQFDVTSYTATINYATPGARNCEHQHTAHRTSTVRQMTASSLGKRTDLHVSERDWVHLILKPDIPFRERGVVDVERGLAVQDHDDVIALGGNLKVIPVVVLE